MPNNESVPAIKTSAEAALYETALRLLTQREHSRVELSQKLQQLGGNSSTIEKLLDELSAKNYLNDARFAEAYVRMRMQRGMGPLKIRHELRLKGLDAALISTALQTVDWHALLLELCLKKQTLGHSLHQKDREKQQRFWLQRGFQLDQIRDVLKTS